MSFAPYNPSQQNTPYDNIQAQMYQPSGGGLKQAPNSFISPTRSLSQAPVSRSLQGSSVAMDSAHQVSPKLWVGDASSARDLGFLSMAKIGAVLNVTRDVPNFHADYQAKEIEYMRIPVNDSLQDVDIERMRVFLPHAASFIYKNRDLEGKHVLVHCAAGIQRSATVAAFFLHLYEDVPLTQAIEQVVRARSQAFHHGTQLNFRKSLEKQQRF